MEKILITGGGGFLGYHLCKNLNTKFKEIIIVDVSPIEQSEYPKNVKYYNIDITDFRKFNEVVARSRPKMIIHTAAALPLYSKKRIWEVNVEGTKNVLESALINQVKRVVFISSTAVYGIPKKHPIYETDNLIGVGPYGRTKIVAEKICLEYRKRGLCVPIIRPKTFIGPERLGVFEILYDWVRNGKRIPIIGNGKNKYQLLDVRDLVDAIALMLFDNNTDKVNDTFNVGAEKFNTVYEDVSALCRYSGSGSKVMTTPANLTKSVLVILEYMKLSPLYKWVYETADKDSFVSIDKIKTRFNWRPKYSNADTLIDSYRWYLKNMEKIKNKTGVTHRVAWDQGFLGIIKKVM